MGMIRKFLNFIYFFQINIVELVKKEHESLQLEIAEMSKESRIKEKDLQIRLEQSLWNETFLQKQNKCFQMEAKRARQMLSQSNITAEEVKVNLTNLQSTLRTQENAVHAVRSKLSIIVSYLQKFTDFKHGNAGDRISYCDPVEQPLPRQVTIARYRATIFHKGQPTKNRDNIVCKKCFEKGHFISNCTNDWKCNICKKSRHRQSECEEPFSDNNNETESTNTDDDNTDSDTDDNNDETEHIQQHDTEQMQEMLNQQMQKMPNQQMQKMPNQQSHEVLTHDPKEVLNKNSQDVPTQQSQPLLKSITNAENDENTGQAATSSPKKTIKKIQ
ncbi:unnamed protein product [Mytilus coruscus]|uniref:CCHC-type domain-containing protein n=1 Tax=Mytilus coruscus TaxID=42192 RepID=A0A6J8CG65_MYTCO|nr:unnamed protein product [Mytilus coruscus]